MYRLLQVGLLLVNLCKTISPDLVLGNATGMTDQQIAIAAAKKLCVLIVGQPGLDGYLPEIITVKLLNAIGERDPAEIILIDLDLADRAL